MKAHKVPATYYASWKIPGTKHSFYVFYKDKLYSEGQSKSYKDVDKITQEHSFFMEENFYYLDIENMPGLAYKLQNEIEEFLSNSPYSIKCEDTYAEDSAPSVKIEVMAGLSLDTSTLRIRLSFIQFSICVRRVPLRANVARGFDCLS